VRKPKSANINRLALSASIANKIYPYEEIVELATIQSTNTETRGSILFTLSDLNGAATLSTLYDCYRFIRVVACFTPVGVQQVVSSYSVAGQSVPVLYTAVDYNDSTAPTDLAEISKYSTLRSAIATKMQTRSLIPRHLSMVYNGALSTAYALGNPKMWLSTTNAAVPHYGIKYVLTPDPGASLINRFNFVVRVKYVLQFSKRK